MTRDAGGSPLVDALRHGTADREIRLMAAQDALGLAPADHEAICELLAKDADAEVARAAAASLRALRAADGQAPARVPSEVPPATPDDEEPAASAVQRLATMTPVERLVRAMRGTREERAVLVRDPNRMVAVAVLSSPKITETEVENIAKMGNVSEEILRIIGNTRAWTKSYAIVAALVRNAKTPVGVSLSLLPRLAERDIKALALDRNVPEALRAVARKRSAPR